MTPEQVRALSTVELVAIYNRLTGKSITRFASRAKGEAQVLKVLQAANVEAARARVARSVAPIARTVNGSASEKRGRPKSRFIVQLTEANGKSKPQKESDRMKLIEWLRAKGPITHEGAELPNAASIDSIETHFAKRMRGVVQKLLDKGWLKRIALAAAQ